MADDARDLFNIEVDEFQKKAKVRIATRNKNGVGILALIAAGSPWPKATEIEPAYCFFLENFVRFWYALLL